MGSLSLVTYVGVCNMIFYYIYAQASTMIILILFLLGHSQDSSNLDHVKVLQKDESVKVLQKDEAVTKLQNVSADFSCWQHPLSAELQEKVSNQVYLYSLFYNTVQHFRAAFLKIILLGLKYFIIFNHILSDIDIQC